MNATRLTAALAALFLATAALAAPVPLPPYFSVQLGTADSREQALERLKPYAAEPEARAEQRGTWQIRVGTFAERGDAEAALSRLRAQAPQARILDMRTAAPWLRPDGSLTAPGAVAPAAPAATAPAPTPASAPASTPAPAVSRGGAVPIAPIVPEPARPIATNWDVTPEFRDWAGKLDIEMRRWLRDTGAVRDDGFLYTMDIAPLLLYAAQRGDQALYLQALRAARPLIVESASDPYARGFVLWRRKAGQPLDVSGATEALWMARALWQGADSFNRAEDRALALTVMEGYSRHAIELSGMWMVRKYFGFTGRTFGSLSNLGNYHPDFLAEVEKRAPRADWNDFAERSYALLERARNPAGLLNPLIQPEVAATYPDLNVGIYAPNGIASLQDACAGAEGAVRGRPKLADALLKFSRDGDHQAVFGRLHAFFDANSGEPVGIGELSTNGYACLARLAVARDNRGAYKEMAPYLLDAMKSIANVPSVQAAPLYDGGQLLLTAYALGAFNEKK